MRRHRRLELRFRKANSPDVPRCGYTEDVTASGLFIQCGVVLPPRTCIIIEMDIDGESIEVTGQVVWAKRAPSGLTGNKRHGMGVKLDGANGALAEFVARL